MLVGARLRTSNSCTKSGCAAHLQHLFSIVCCRLSAKEQQLAKLTTHLSQTQSDLQGAQQQQLQQRGQSQEHEQERGVLKAEHQAVLHGRELTPVRPTCSEAGSSAESRAQQPRVASGCEDVCGPLPAQSPEG